MKKSLQETINWFSKDEQSVALPVADLDDVAQRLAT
jgi:hypothetical protein